VLLSGCTVTGDHFTIVEAFRFGQINKALARLASGKARYRIVLSNHNTAYQSEK